MSFLQLAGHGNDPGLHRLGIASAVAETVVGARIEIQSKPALRPLKEGGSGWLTRAGGLLAGPLPLALRLLAGRSDSPRSANLRRAAAIAGSFITRARLGKGGASVSAGSEGNSRAVGRLTAEDSQTHPRANLLITREL